jgi:hypothetical protein
MRKLRLWLTVIAISLPSLSCGGRVVLEELDCSANLTATGAVNIQWDSNSGVTCDGHGPWIEDQIDLYFTVGYNVLRIRIDWVAAGATGSFTDTFVSIKHKDDQWGAYGNLSCTVTIDRNEYIGKTLFSDVYVVEGSASCEGPLTPFQSQGTVSFEKVSFVGWYEEMDELD